MVQGWAVRFSFSRALLCLSVDGNSREPSRLEFIRIQSGTWGWSKRQRQTHRRDILEGANKGSSRMCFLPSLKHKISAFMLMIENIRSVVNVRSFALLAAKKRDEMWSALHFAGSWHARGLSNRIALFTSTKNATPSTTFRRWGKIFSTSEAKINSLLSLRFFISFAKNGTFLMWKWKKFSSPFLLLLWVKKRKAAEKPWKRLHNQRAFTNFRAICVWSSSSFSFFDLFPRERKKEIFCVAKKCRPRPAPWKFLLVR